MTTLFLIMNINLWFYDLPQGQRREKPEGVGAATPTALSVTEFFFFFSSFMFLFLFSLRSWQSLFASQSTWAIVWLVMGCQPNAASGAASVWDVGKSRGMLLLTFLFRGLPSEWSLLWADGPAATDCPGSSSEGEVVVMGWPWPPWRTLGSSSVLGPAGLMEWLRPEAGGPWWEAAKLGVVAGLTSCLPEAQVFWWSCCWRISGLCRAAVMVMSLLMKHTVWPPRLGCDFHNRTILSSPYLHRKPRMMLCLVCISHRPSTEIVLISCWRHWSRNPQLQSRHKFMLVSAIARIYTARVSDISHLPLTLQPLRWWPHSQ